jgi:hypothetical protein
MLQNLECGGKPQRDTALDLLSDKLQDSEQVLSTRSVDMNLARPFKAGKG